MAGMEHTGVGKDKLWVGSKTGGGVSVGKG